ANSARNWSLSAWISAIDSGVAASSRRVVSRTARLCTSGTIISPHSIESRKPIARYMIGSIMVGNSARGKDSLITIARAAGKRPARCRVNVNSQPEAFGSPEAGSERVPCRPRGIFEIADIGAQTQSDAGADRHQHDVVGGERGHAEAADDIGR